MSAEYRDLPELVGKPRLAAVNAYTGSSSNFSLDKSSNCYILSDKLGSLDVSISMSRPNAGETGGGEFASPEWTERSDYKELFDQIRKRVDKIVKPWMDLLNPYSNSFSGKINEYREKVAAISSETSIKGLDPTTKTTDVSTVKLQSSDEIAPGRVRTLLKGMDDCAPALEGSAFNTFRTTFVTSMPSVIENLALLAHVHSETLLAERLFLKRLRRKVVEAVEKTVDAFGEIIEEEDGVSFDILLSILIWGCMTATILGGGATAAAHLAGGASVLLAVLKDVRSLKSSKTAKKATLEVDNFEGMMKEFRRAFEEIGDSFKAAEEAVSENLRYNTKLVLGDRARHGCTDTSLHLTPAPIQDAAGATRMDENAASQMTVSDRATGGYMSRIAVGLEKAAKALTDISVVDLVRRKHNIGMGPTGPDEAFAELRQVLYEPLQGLRWKVDEGSVNLRTTMQDFQESNASSQEALNAIASNAVQRSGMDPWGHKKQREENPRPHSNDNV